MPIEPISNPTLKQVVGLKNIDGTPILGYNASLNDVLYAIQQLGGGGGGGSATSENQLIEIDVLNSINDGLGTLATEDTLLSTLENLVNIQGSTESTNQSILKLIDENEVPLATNLKSLLTVLQNSYNVLINVANQSKQTDQINAIGTTNDSLSRLISSSTVAGNTNLKDILTSLGSLQILTNNVNTSVNNLLTSTDNYVFGALKGLEGSGQSFVRVNTNANIVLRCDYQNTGYVAQKKFLNLQIEANAGATGTINVEVRTSSTAPYITIPLIDKQATFVGSYINPPYNVAGAKLYQLDVTGIYDVRFTFSIPSASYFINYSSSVN